jgi:hypothetical protein
MENFKFQRLAKMMLDQLSAREQAAVRRKLAALEGVAPDDWPPRLVKRAADDPTIYVLKVDKSLRAILQAVNGQQPEVLDLFRREAAENFMKSGKT